ncbi:uncharacterized protein B0I36DRAFT_320351 [Microdochium trichocladiopsis]|uniref:Uncharacterized protein n=1 Tax=Microdochium trichocladiopsis TaxID=1682393 RepID=A0A9P8YAR8_9PEZI|nr:uncharacterized protein B0I36DRAFT_320351 [Microdochium trichocladiopsis]KAH7032924.1 hypothetical protein B0I36DRAFT_320351 [Microdochium trichocladiopsis]
MRRATAVTHGRGSRELASFCSECTERLSSSRVQPYRAVPRLSEEGRFWGCFNGPD